MLKFIEQSAAARVIDDAPKDDDIHVILQYFEHDNAERDMELKLALCSICEHPLVTVVHLLNERIYDDLTDPKIRQHCLGRRLKFKDVFQYLREHQVRGYHVIVNSDICFDETLANLRRSDLHVSKKMLSPLRYEVLDTDAFQQGMLDLNSCPVFGPRIDSQDAWIFHSYQTIPEKFEKVFNFQFGKPGCDNKMIYLMRILGYDVVNDPAFVKTYHIHASQDRNYMAKDRVPPPYAYLGPYGYDMAETAGYYLPPSRPYNDVDYENANRVLRKYLVATKNRPYVIPRICPESNNIDKNLAAFDHCELYAGWESFGHEVRHLGQTHDLMLERYPKTMIWAQAFEIFHYIYRQPWTQALHNQRILLVSPLADQMCAQSSRRTKFYDGVDLFPECTFLGLESADKLDTVQGQYDVALVSCGKESNAVCASIYKRGHSAICVGPALPMYFGILGKQWLRDRPDVVRLFLNEAWTQHVNRV